MINLQLSRNLRRQILQGQPWIFADAIKEKKSKQFGMAKLHDHKNQFLAWGIYQADSPLCFRVLSTLKHKPREEDLKKVFLSAIKLRAHLKSNAYRLINGEGDRLPGLIIDRYNDMAVAQFDGRGVANFWQNYPLFHWLKEALPIKSLVVKPRSGEQSELKVLGSPLAQDEILIEENDLQFYVNVRHGQKTGFFLDQRDNRQHLKNFCAGKNGLNLFSYTGGFSVYAGAGNCRSITSLDSCKEALELAEKNWSLNRLAKESHQTLIEDAYKYMRDSQEKYDFIVVDPPCMAREKEQVSLALEKYIELFSSAAKKVRPGGDLFLSSCTARVTAEDFSALITEALSRARRTGRILRFSGAGSDHPVPHNFQQFRYLKFVHLNLER